MEPPYREYVPSRPPRKSPTRGLTELYSLFCLRHLKLVSQIIFFVQIIEKWIKLTDQTPKVCFGAKHDQFGRFWIPFTGFLVRVKLVHLYGEIWCGPKWTPWFYWGCHWGKINTVITNSSRFILLPRSETGSKVLGFQIPEYSPRSPELVFPDIQPRLPVVSGQEMRIWNNEDLLNDNWAGDNSGSVCVDVYVMINLW